MLIRQITTKMELKRIADACLDPEIAEAFEADITVDGQGLFSEATEDDIESLNDLLPSD